MKENRIVPCGASNRRGRIHATDGYLGRAAQVPYNEKRKGRFIQRSGVGDMKWPLIGMFGTVALMFVLSIIYAPGQE